VTCSLTSGCKKAFRTVVTYAQVSSVPVPCAFNDTDLNEGHCLTDVNRWCIGQKYGGGWFVQNNASEMQVICSSAPTATIPTTFVDLKTQHAGCASVADYSSGPCVAAADHICVNAGYAGGFGVVEHDGGNNAQIVCAPYSLFTRRSPTATGACTQDISTAACYAVADNYCLSNGFPGGLGAVQHNPIKNTMDVLCVNP
jgi:hypothetical protein